VILDGTAQTVIGVLPARFSFPDLALEPDVYGPLDLDGDTSIPLQKRMTGWLLDEAVGRAMTETFRIVDGVTRKTILDPMAKANSAKSGGKAHR